MTPLIQKLRSAGEAERTLAPASGLFDEAADEIERLTADIALFEEHHGVLTHCKVESSVTHFDDYGRPIKYVVMLSRRMEEPQ